MNKIALIAAQAALALVLYAMGAIILALALIPAYHFYCWVVNSVDPLVMPLSNFLGITGGYFVFGLSLMLIVGLIRSLFAVRLKEGEFKIGTPESIKWFFVNALFLLVRTLFMDFMLLTPFCSLFYRMMGVKLGLNVQINSKNVADHSLLEIGDNSVIGGNATVIGHIFEPKGLRLSKVRIGKRVVVGLNSVIMPGVTIGDGSVIAAGAIVPKNTVIEPDTIYYSPDKQVKRSK